MVKINANEKTLVTIYNIEGRKIREYNITKGSNTLNLNSLPKGVYIIEGLNKHGNSTKKLVLEN